MSKPIENHVLPSELSDLNLDKAHLRKGHRIFRRDREPFGIPILFQRLRNMSRKVR